VQQLCDDGDRGSHPGPGVQDVAVELATGHLTVTSDSSLDPALIKGAVEEAGYQLAAS